MSPPLVEQPSESSHTARRPSIDLWYGPKQLFGHLGNPQWFVNVLGRVSPPEKVASLSYSLNAGPARRLTIGPDGKRLQAPGDFNIELDTGELIAGPNRLLIAATDANGRTATRSVTVRYTSGRTWPIPYRISWRSLTSIQQAAQVVDGRWAIQDGGLHCVEPGYDRLVALGDLTWTDYLVEVRFAINAFSAIGEYAPGIGLLLRWRGYYDWEGARPRSGWWPIGAIGWYLHLGQWGQHRLNLMGNRGRVLAEDAARTQLLEGVTYTLKLAADTPTSGASRFRMKIWPRRATEPSDWLLTAAGPEDALASGSCLLLAHHTDATFGDITVTALP